MHRFSLNRFNFSLLIPALMLVTMGLSVFYSIDPQLFRQQLIFFFICLVGYVIFLNIDYRIFQFYSTYLYVGIVVLFLLVFAIGVEARGAVRWFELFGIRLQFSEIAKPFFLIVLSHFLTRNESRSFTKFLKAIFLSLPVVFLTLKQPDLGNAIVYVSVVYFILFVYRFPLSYLVLLALSFLLPIPILFEFLHSYQKERILSFFNISSDPFGSSYNAIQSFIAIGSGGIAGKGLGQATQSLLKFLPERHTDFIFSTIAESLGFVGSIIMLSLFGFLLYKTYRIASEVRDEFSYLFVSGFYFLLLIHIFFNIGMNVGVLPVVGVTLPFLSYGGSSLLTHFIFLGIISSVCFECRRKLSIEIR